MANLEGYKIHKLEMDSSRSLFVHMVKSPVRAVRALPALGFSDVCRALFGLTLKPIPVTSPKVLTFPIKAPLSFLLL